MVAVVVVLVIEVMVMPVVASHSRKITFCLAAVVDIEIVEPALYQLVPDGVVVAYPDGVTAKVTWQVGVGTWVKLAVMVPAPFIVAVVDELPAFAKLMEPVADHELNW